MAIKIDYLCTKLPAAYGGLLMLILLSKIKGIYTTYKAITFNVEKTIQN